MNATSGRTFPHACIDHILQAARAGWWLLPVLLTLWFATQRYEGIYHDGELYTFQALAHVHPDLLGNDLYLRYGSQDRYTLFSPIYAALMRFVGVENAAKILTALMQAVLLLTIGVFARALRLGSGAVLALCCALCLPPVYGTGQYFHFLENFVSPRMIGEAFSLMALACNLTGRRWLGTLFLLAAFALHPIIALAAVAFMIWLRLFDVGWKAVVTACVGGALLIGLLALWPALRQDDVWYFAVRESLGYLFVSDWSRSGYTQTLLPLLLLTAAASHPAAHVRRVALAGLATGVSGLVASLLGADILHLTIFVQAQLWRCMWLTALVAAMLAPETALMLWTRGTAGRCALFLLASAYLFASSSTLLVIAPLTLLTLGIMGSGWSKPIAPRQQKLLLAGTVAVFALGLLANLGQKALEVGIFLRQTRAMGIDERINDLTADGVLPALLVLLCAWLWRLCRTHRAQLAYMALGSAITLLCAGFYISSFAVSGYPSALRDALRSWQALIPERSEVFIPEEPMLSWTVLLRPSYISTHQAVSEVFSRTAAMEARRRARTTNWFLSAHQLQIWDDLRTTVDRPPTLSELCSSKEFRFVVSRFDLDTMPIGTLPDSVPAWLRTLRLYQCPPSD